MDRGIKKIKQKEFISVKEACEKFGDNRWSLRRKINRFNIESKTEGRQTLVKVSDLKKLYKPKRKTKPKKVKKGKIKKTVAIIHKQQRIQITLTCKAFMENKIFNANDVDKQVKWLEKYRKKYEKGNHPFGDRLIYKIKKNNEKTAPN
jgi:hypothetical protein